MAAVLYVLWLPAQTAVVVPIMLAGVAVTLVSASVLAVEFPTQFTARTLRVPVVNPEAN